MPHGIAMNMHLTRIKIYCVRKIIDRMIIIYRVRHGVEFLNSHLVNE